MSDAHEHLPPPPPPVTPEDSGSQALADALRSSFLIIKILLVLLAGYFLCSGIFTVGPQERAIVLRLGKAVGEGEKVLRGPGFHWAFPAPIDEVVRIPAGQIRIARSTACWYATTPEMEAAKTEPPPGDSLNPVRDGYALTSDANIIHVRATLRYRITDPVRYEFGFTHAPMFITNALNNALLYAAAHFTVDRVLSTDVAAFREKVRARIEETIDQQQLGIAIEQSDVDPISPRQEKVRVAFNAALQAGIKRETLLNAARSYGNEVLSKAQSDASARTNAAWTERTRLVEFVAAEAKKFTDLLPEYQANPELFTLLRQTEALERTLANAQEKIFVPSAGAEKARKLWLQLSREPAKPKAAPEPVAVDRH
jgi:modulator of FtsH protease HflK